MAPGGDHRRGGKRAVGVGLDALSAARGSRRSTGGGRGNPPAADRLRAEDLGQFHEVVREEARGTEG